MAICRRVENLMAFSGLVGSDIKCFKYSETGEKWVGRECRASPWHYGLAGGRVRRRIPFWVAVICSPR